VRGFGPMVVAMDSHGGSLYAQVRSDSQGRRAKALASLGVKSKQV
jgi:L(+)-tartrate dehydratase beta subunit